MNERVLAVGGLGHNDFAIHDREPSPTRTELRHASLNQIRLGLFDRAERVDKRFFERAGPLQCRFSALHALPTSRRGRGLTNLQTAAFEMPLLSSKPMGQEQDDDDDQDNADHADAAVAIAVAIAAKPSTEAAKQKYDKNDEEYESNRHEKPPLGSAAS
jgi:hypothetical protein